MEIVAKFSSATIRHALNQMYDSKYIVDISDASDYLNLYLFMSFIRMQNDFIQNKIFELFYNTLTKQNWQKISIYLYERMPSSLFMHYIKVFYMKMLLSGPDSTSLDLLTGFGDLNSKIVQHFRTHEQCFMRKLFISHVSSNPILTVVDPIEELLVHSSTLAKERNANLLLELSLPK